MKTIFAAGCVVLCALSTSVSARAPEDFAKAWSTCESGRASARYVEAADACWGAYDAAVAKGDFNSAIRAADTGCGKYRRSDYCLFTNQLSKAPRVGEVLKVGSQHSAGRDDLRRAEAMVSATDVEDGERGFLLRAQNGR